MASLPISYGMGLGLQGGAQPDPYTGLIVGNIRQQQADKKAEKAKQQADLGKFTNDFAVSGVNKYYNPIITQKGAAYLNDTYNLYKNQPNNYQLPAQQASNKFHSELLDAQSMSKELDADLQYINEAARKGLPLTEGQKKLPGTNDFNDIAKIAADPDSGVYYDPKTHKVSIKYIPQKSTYDSRAEALKNIHTEISSYDATGNAPASLSSKGIVTGSREQAIEAEIDSKASALVNNPEYVNRAIMYDFKDQLAKEPDPNKKQTLLFDITKKALIEESPIKVTQTFHKNDKPDKQTEGEKDFVNSKDYTDNFTIINTPRGPANTSGTLSYKSQTITPTIGVDVIDTKTGKPSDLNVAGKSATTGSGFIQAVWDSGNKDVPKDLAGSFVTDSELAKLKKEGKLDQIKYNVYVNASFGDRVRKKNIYYDPEGTEEYQKDQYIEEETGRQTSLALPLSNVKGGIKGVDFGAFEEKAKRLNKEFKKGGSSKAEGEKQSFTKDELKAKAKAAGYSYDDYYELVKNKINLK